jgi:hypothetical protein
MLLGKKIVQHLEGSDIVEKVFLDTDFLDRTVLKIVIDHDIYSILANTKIDELLDDIWNGKEYYKCNGKTSDFSMLAYLSKLSIYPLSRMFRRKRYQSFAKQKTKVQRPSK